MAENDNNQRRADWERAITTYQNLSQQLDEAIAEDSDALECAIVDAEEDVLDTPAPSFSAVIKKLYLLWDGRLIGLDPETEAKRLILEDLDTLVAESIALLA